VHDSKALHDVDKYIMVAEATVQTVLDADRKTVAAAASESQAWSLQRMKASFNKLKAEPQLDVEAPKAEEITPVPYYSLYK
jgi:hypothetical protein